jgi:hypothetical protein
LSPDPPLAVASRDAVKEQMLKNLLNLPIFHFATGAPVVVLLTGSSRSAPLEHDLAVLGARNLFAPPRPSVTGGNEKG